MTVTELFKQIGIDEFQCVRWGCPFDCSSSGIYIVSSCGDPDAEVPTCRPRFDGRAIHKWIDRLPHFTLDGMKPDEETLVQRLRTFWLPRENVLYIGQTGSSLTERVKAYCTTELGARKPHSGGQWLKTLRNIEELFVYIAPADDAKNKERILLNYFRASAGELPFANLTGPCGRKSHGLKGQRDPKRKPNDR